MEWWTYHRAFVVEAADLDGSTTSTYGNTGVINAHPVLEVEDVLDRDEIGTMAYLDVGCHAAGPSTQTADGSVRHSGMLTTGRTREGVLDYTASLEDVEGEEEIGNIVSSVQQSGPGGGDDTGDILHRPLVATAGSNFSDGPTGVGGAADGSRDTTKDLLGRGGPQLDPRDNVYWSFAIESQNVADAAIHGEVTARMGFIVEDRR